MTAPDHAREVRNALSDPGRLCHGLGVDKGSERQSGGGITILCPEHQERTASCSVTRGEDGTIRCHCFGCGWTGDALSLIASVRGWALVGRGFADTLAEGARIAGNHQLEAEIRNGSEAPVVERQAVPDPLPERPREYPRLADVEALWDTGTSALDDSEVSEYLRGRAISPTDASERRLVRVLSREHTLPSWARYRGKAEQSSTWLESGHRLITRMWDSSGSVRSVRAWRVGGSDATPKRLPPSGHSATDLVLANRAAVEMLVGRDDCPRRLIVVEGEPDWLTHSTRTFDAVIGLMSGSWSQAFADRVPVGSEVIVRTHHDQAGDKYAKSVIESLKERAAVWRSQPQ